MNSAPGLPQPDEFERWLAWVEAPSQRRGGMSGVRLYAKHIFLRLDAHGRVELALLDLEKSRRRLTRRLAARHDLRQLRRHSAWGAAEWESLGYGYRQACGQRIDIEKEPS